MIQRLYLLPGLHGNGDLYRPFVKALAERSALDVKLLSYPTELTDYAAVSNFVEAELRECPVDFALFAESFSGPVAIRLAAKKIPRLARLILCATFASNPVRTRLESIFLKNVPARLTQLPLPEFLLRRLFLDAPADCDIQCRDFSRVLREVPPQILKARLREVLQCDDRALLARIKIPTLLLFSKRDQVVPHINHRRLAEQLTHAEVAEFDSPHFVVQSRAPLAAQAVLKFLES